MNKSDYDKYYKKGGTYVIPVELFNELFDELKDKNEEIEILKTKWDKLKKWANEPKVYICHYHILDKMNEIEQGSESNE